LLGQTKRDAGAADLLLRTHEALAHRGRRCEERGRDCLRIEAEHDLQHQRCADSGLERRVSARKEQREPAIRDVGGAGRFDAVGQELQLLAGRLPSAAPSGDVDRFAARDRQQPCLRVCGTTVHRPVFERRGECIGQRIFRSGDVTCVGGDEGD
jgi:hypothetical protein